MPQLLNLQNKCGIYQLSCPDCTIKFIRQTDRPLQVRFKQHFNDFKYENGKSKSAQHLLQKYYSTGPMENIMEVLQVTRKRRMMNTF
jgi:hypothetical protein